MRSGRFGIVLSGLALLVSVSARADEYKQFNIVSDLNGMAPVIDGNLMNPWGMSFSGTSPIWVSNQGSNTATLYNALAPGGPKVPLTVNILTNPTPPNGPTGQVFNSTTSDFMIPAAAGGTVKSAFIFDTLSGTIQGWAGAAGVGGPGASETVASVAGAVFTGLALASSAGANYLYAADATGHIDVFDKTFTNVTGTTFAGKFVDPSPIAPFTPFNIQAVNVGGTTELFVTYATAGPKGVPLPGGYVDEFDTAGNFLQRIATNGPINSPWGVALAPAGWGKFGGDLLIGNLYDSVINAYKLTPTPTFDGSLAVSTGFASPVGLWALDFGNGSSGDPNTLYFTSGINDQKDGLFGAIAFVPEPSPGLLMAVLAAAAGIGSACNHLRRKF